MPVYTHLLNSLMIRSGITAVLMIYFPTIVCFAFVDEDICSKNKMKHIAKLVCKYVYYGTFAVYTTRLYN